MHSTGKSKSLSHLNDLMRPTCFAMLFILLLSLMHVRAAESTLVLNLRSRTASKADTNRSDVTERKAIWDAKKTALVVCDMWDDHWCKSAARRVGEMAEPLNEVVKQAR